MTPHEYLEGLLGQQAMRQSDVDALRSIRDEIEGRLRQAYGTAPRFYYGGSYGKDTMIRASFDLDIVIYFPSAEQATLRGIYQSVYKQLVDRGYMGRPKTVALRLPYEGGFHVDVVPGKAQDDSYHYATLFKSEGSGSTLQTSLKVHIDAVRKTGIRDAVKLMKLWRLRQGLTWSTFALEITVRRALDGRAKNDHGAALRTVFEFILNHLMSVRLVDPANTNNEIDMSGAERNAVVAKAREALNASYWNHVVW